LIKKGQLLLANFIGPKMRIVMISIDKRIEREREREREEN